MAKVNLWELITTIDSSQYDLPNKDHCKEIRDAGAKNSFSSELSLEIDERGNWIIETFYHEIDNYNKVILHITPHGTISITRKQSIENNIEELRTISF